MPSRRVLWCIGVLTVTNAAVAVAGSRVGHARPSAQPSAPRPAAYADLDAPAPAGRTNDGYPAMRGDALVRAAARREAMAVPAAATLAGLGRNSWSSLGPDNYGGRLRSIVIDRSKPQTMYVGGVEGGVFKTTNGGKTWRALDDFMGNLSVSTLVSPAASPRTLYAGTGEWFGTRYRGAGVFKSVDGGATWNQLAATAAWQYVNRLAVDRRAGATLLAATTSGIFRTENGGKNWTPTYAQSAQDIAFDPRGGGIPSFNSSPAIRG
jgi:hypothetical protein